MARKTYFETFHEKISEKLIWGNAGKDYGFLWGLVFDFEESLTSFKFKHLI